MASYTTGQAPINMQQVSAVPSAYQGDALELARAQRLAQMLSSSEPAQGQMISGRYVAPSWTQNLAQLVNAASGAYFANKAETQQQALAEKLRQGETEAFADFMKTKLGTPARPAPVGYELGDAGTPAVAPNLTRAYANLYADPRAPQRLRDMAFNKIMADPEAFTLNEGSIRYEKQPDGSVRQVAAGPEKFRAPIQVDTGTHIEFRDAIDPSKVLQRVPKSQMPQAGQVVETAQGPMIVNTRTGEAAPIMAGGQPLPPKLSTEQSKDITAINQQRAVVDSALKLVQTTPTAFSFGRGVAGAIPLGETIAGRTEKPAETEARAAVFNIVSKVINERAGAAQSNQEIKRLNAFLPSEYDNSKQIENKLNGFKKYLDEQEKGTRVSTSASATPPAPAQAKAFSSQTDVQKAITEGKVKKGDKVTVNGVTGTIQ
jgi:hypothetical protein